eukprot:1159521-Pelagomonas_calceolata.AAC.4
MASCLILPSVGSTTPLTTSMTPCPWSATLLISSRSLGLPSAATPAGVWTPRSRMWAMRRRRTTKWRSSTTSGSDSSEFALRARPCLGRYLREQCARHVARGQTGIS